MLIARFPKFIGEAEKADLVGALERIAKAILDRRADFLFGAGMSVPPPSSIPSGRALAKKLLMRLFPDADAEPALAARLNEWTSTVPLECIAQAVESLPGRKRADLTPFLRDTLLAGDPPLNEAHKKFLSVYNWDGQPRLRRIYTTNFDKLLEKCFSSRGITVTEKNARDIDTIESKQNVPVLHLHGTLDDDEYQITEADLFTDKSRRLHGRFEGALRDADAFTFVGYSMGDPDFRSIYLNYQDDIRSRQEEDKDSYVVSPVDTLEEYRLGKAIWRGRRAIWLPLDAEAFFGAIKDLLESKTSKEMDDAIMKKYHLKDREAYQEKVKQTAEILAVSEADAIQFLYETRPKTG